MPARPSTRLARIEREVGELLDEYGGSSSVDLSEWADDPVGLAVRIGREPVDYQAEVMRDVVDHRFNTWRGCHSCGKEHVAGTLAVWGVARRMLVLVISATEGQTVGQTMREVGDGFAAAHREFGLAFKRFRRSIRIGGEDRVVALTGSANVDALTGWHDPNGVLVIISEGQGERLEDAAYDAALGNANTERGRVLAMGNPTRPSGRFFEINQKSSWRVHQTSAFDTPNVRAGETVIPGFPGPNWPDEMAAEHGRQSPFYIGRVLGEFPDSAVDGMFRRSWLDAAAERYDRLLMEARREKETPFIALDVSRSGPDDCVAAIRRGRVVERLETWSFDDTTDTVRRVADLARELGLVTRQESGVVRSLSSKDVDVGHIIVDAVGLGGPIADRLRELGWNAKDFKAGENARRRSRFANAKAEAFWTLRNALEAGDVALPPDERLFKELLAHTYATDARSRVRMESKSEVKDRLGHSPDAADAVAQAFSPKVQPSGPVSALIAGI